MLTKLVKLIASAALAVSSVLAVPSAAMAATLPEPCSTGAQTHDGGKTTWQRYAHHEWPGGAYLKYNGVVGETRVRDLFPCESSGGGSGAVMIWVANMDNIYTGGNGYVQIGYVETSGQGYNGVPGGSRKFAYTPNDHNGGIWAVLNIPAVGDPLPGHRYQMKVKTDGSGWFYCIQDEDGDNHEYCLSTSASSQTWTQGTRGFWMFETQNSHDSLGNPDGQPTTYIVQMQYRTTNGQWFYHDGPCDGFSGSSTYYRCVDGGTNDIRGYSL